MSTNPNQFYENKWFIHLVFTFVSDWKVESYNYTSGSYIK